MSMKPLAGRVALVTGASRGVGRGVALGLGEAGARVYVTARTLTSRSGSPRSGNSSSGSSSLEQTARDVRSLGGDCIPLACDHTDDSQTRAVMERIFHDGGGLDILVNSVWGGYENMIEAGQFTWTLPFWQQPLWRWDAMFDSGVRAAFVCARLAVPNMIERGAGLIVNLSYWAAQKYMANALYGVAKCATDRLTRDMARDLADTGVTVVSLYPGLVRTESVMAAADQLDLSNSESPQFVGRAVAHLAADPELGERTGTVLVAAELAKEYGFTDIDGAQPRPLTLDTA